MVVPREHGAWGMLLVPLMTGAVVAAGPGFNFIGLALFCMAALALFWMRTPVEAWLGTSAIRAQTPEERVIVTRVSLGLLVLAVAALATLFSTGLSRSLLIIGSVAAAAFGAQAFVKSLGRSGRMPAQVIGAIGLTSTAAGAYAVAAGRLGRTALVLWLLNWLFAWNQVHFVQLRIHGSRLASITEKLRKGYAFFAAQVALLLAAVSLSHFGMAPRFLVLAFVPALVRGYLWFLRGAEALDVRKLGVAELAQALLFGTLLCIVFLV